MREEEYRKSAMDKPKSILSHYKLFPLAGHTDIVRSVAWSPDGKMLASGAKDNTIKLWDGEMGTLLHMLKGHTNTVWSVAWAPEENVLASGSDDETVKLWDGETGCLLQTLEGHGGGGVNSVAWMPYRKVLASGA